MNIRSFMIRATVLLICVLFASFIPTVAEANPGFSGFHFLMTVSIQSPRNGTVCDLPLLVNFTAEGLWFPSNSSTQSFFYVLDGQNMTSGIRVTEVQYPQFGTPTSTDGQWYDYSGQVNLTNLGYGLHNITIYYGVYSGEIILYNASSPATETSQFYVTTKPPSPTPALAPTPTLTPAHSSSSDASTTSNVLPSPTVPEITSVTFLVLAAGVCIVAVIAKKRIQLHKSI